MRPPFLLGVFACASGWRCRRPRSLLLQHLARVLLALAHDGVKPVPLQPQLLPARVVAGDAKKNLSADRPRRPGRR